MAAQGRGWQDDSRDSEHTCCRCLLLLSAMVSSVLFNRLELLGRLRASPSAGGRAAAGTLRRGAAGAGRILYLMLRLRSGLLPLAAAARGDHSAS